MIIKTYGSGSHFGSTVMLGIHKAYLGTLVVLQTCHVLSIPRSSFLQALETYPSMGALQELKRTELVATEELRQAIQRISARKLIWKRYQHLICEGGGDNMSLAKCDENSTGFEMLTSMVQQWHLWASSNRTRRERSEREKAQYERMMEHWRRKHQIAQARVQRKREVVERRNECLAARMPNPWPPAPDEEEGLAAEEDSELTPAAAARAEAKARLAEAANSRQEQLAVLISDWPAPRQSPHYGLKVWDVLAAVAGEGTRLGAQPLVGGPRARTSTPRSRGHGEITQVASARLSWTW